MNSLTALWARLHEGTRLRVTEHWRTEDLGTIRTITCLQTNGYYFTRGRDGRQGWFPRPRRSEISFPSSSSFRVEQGGRAWTLELLEPDATA